MALRDRPAPSDMQGPLIRKAEGKIHSADLRAENISGPVRQLFFLLVNRLSSPWLSSKPVAWCKHRNVLHQGLASVLFTVLEKEFSSSPLVLAICALSTEESRVEDAERIFGMHTPLSFKCFLCRVFAPFSLMLWLMVLHRGMRELMLSHRHLRWGGQAFHQSPAQMSPTKNCLL